MPALNHKKSNKTEAYSHIYNKAVEERSLFNNQEDYEVFLGYLNDYLTIPPDPEKVKKSFSVNGRTFQGVPHQPKNYFNKVELIAYSLLPDHFHLLANQKLPGTLEKLIRSLCTRYAIYYNKKYQRSGSLFIGPYKSVQIKDVSQLLHLTRYFHHESFKEKGDLKNLNNDSYSSYEDYLGITSNPWVKPQVVLTYFDKSENDYFKGIDGYKNFVESYILKPDETRMLEKIVIESVPEHLEKRDLKPKEIESFKEVHAEPVSESRPKIPAFIATATAVFVFLFALGIKNIKTSVALTENSVTSTPSAPQVSGAEDVQPETKTLVIKIGDGSESVNIRTEPSTKSEIVGKAFDGDTYELISKEEDWYQIKPDNGSNAFISTKYAVIEGEENY